MHAQADVAVDYVAAKLRPQSFDFYNAFRHQPTPTSLNKIANTASTMITTVIEVTTEFVVPMPRLSVLGSMRRPKSHATSAINSPNTMPFPQTQPQICNRNRVG